jgi:hypothetical protein
MAYAFIYNGLAYCFPMAYGLFFSMALPIAFQWPMPLSTMAYAYCYLMAYSHW